MRVTCPEELSPGAGPRISLIRSYPRSAACDRPGLYLLSSLRMRLLNNSLILLNTKHKEATKPREGPRTAAPGWWDDERREGRWGMELWGWRWIEMGG